MNIKIRYLLLSILLSTSSMYSIPQECAYAGGVVACALTGVASYTSFQHIKWLALPIGMAGGYCGYSFFYRFTPAGRIERAESELTIIRGYRLSQEFFVDDTLLLSAIYDLYRLHTWPLVIALDDVTRYMDKALKSIELANAAERADSGYSGRARKVKQIAYSVFENMNKAARVIRTNKDYFVQLGQFKEEQRHREQLQVQQSIAAAHWSNAHAQQQIAAAQKEFVATQQHNPYTQKPAPFINSAKLENVSSVGTTTSSSLSGIFTEREATDYIEQNIAALERALRIYMRSAEVTALKHSVQNAVRNAHQNSSQFLKKDIIDQFISGALLEYIEKTAYEYAYKRTTDSSVATRIAESMRNNALALIVQNSVINFEQFAPFVGFALEKAVNDKIKQQHVFGSEVLPASQASAPVVQVEKQYTSTECCVCLNDFSSDIKRIYLSPCGHDMCKKCAYDWFFGTTQKTTCPQCRGSVNLNKLQGNII